MIQNLTILYAQLGQEIFDSQEKLNRIEFAHNQMVCELTVTRVQRDELLGALKEIVGYWDSVVPADCINDMHRKARAAIAKAGGEA